MGNRKKPGKMERSQINSAAWENVNITGGMGDTNGKANGEINGNRIGKTNR